MKLLGVGNNAKTVKSDAFGEYLTAILYLSPYKLSGQNFCASASKGCIESCLNTAGRGRFNSVQLARLKKSRFFIEQRDLFLKQLQKDIDALKRKCIKINVYPSIRLNGTSDLIWESLTDIIQKNPDCQFYDYTKHYKRMLAFLAGKLPFNYYLTFSRSEENEDKCISILEKGGNVAMVYRKNIPKKYKGFKVINGDQHDLRFLDKQNVVIGLTAKGKAKIENKGFVIDDYE